MVTIKVASWLFLGGQWCCMWDEVHGGAPQWLVFSLEQFPSIYTGFVKFHFTTKCVCTYTDTQSVHIFVY